MSIFSDVRRITVSTHIYTIFTRYLLYESKLRYLALEFTNHNLNDHVPPLHWSAVAADRAVLRVRGCSTIYGSSLKNGTFLDMFPHLVSVFRHTIHERKTHYRDPKWAPFFAHFVGAFTPRKRVFTCPKNDSFFGPLFEGPLSEYMLEDPSSSAIFAASLPARRSSFSCRFLS